MKHSDNTRQQLITHYRAYPHLQIQDLFKYLHQSAFGCEHLVSSPAAAIERIAAEYGGDHLAPAAVEPLDGDYSRVPISYMDNGLTAATFGRLFVASARQEPEGSAALTAKLAVARQLVAEGVLPFSVVEFDDAAERWRAQGYGAVRHSDSFRAHYRPAYRVIHNRFLPFLPLLAQLDRRLSQGKVTLAIEGGSAAGKTTLGGWLCDLYGGTLFHADDFFLQLHQRTPERLAEVGGNLDRERLLAEVLQPLSRGEAIRFRRFDCATMSLSAAETVIPADLVVVEGAYSLHPDLAPYYDLSLFLDVTPDCQRERILRRNSPPMAQRFFTEWIPLERRYFAETNVEQRCTMTVAIDC